MRVIHYVVRMLTTTNRRHQLVFLIGIVAVLCMEGLRAQGFCSEYPIPGEQYGNFIEECADIADSQPNYNCVYSVGNFSAEEVAIRSIERPDDCDFECRQQLAQQCRSQISGLVAGLGDGSGTTIDRCSNGRTINGIFYVQYGAVVDFPDPCRTGVFSGPEFPRSCDMPAPANCTCDDALPFNFENRNNCDVDASQVCNSEGSCGAVACVTSGVCGTSMDVSGVMFGGSPGQFDISCAPAVETNFCLSGDSNTVCIGQGCEAPDGPDNSGGQSGSENNCTANFYTDPQTGEIVCGTFVSQFDNGTTVSTSTDQSGVVTTSTTVQRTDVDGSDVETTTETRTFPDGSSTSSTTIVNNTTGTTTTSSNTGTGFGEGIIGNGTDNSCPSNIFVLHAGVPVCSDLVPASENELQNSASSSESCEIAPVCSGDQIQCQILFQTFLTRCASDFGEDVEAEVDVSATVDQIGLGVTAGDDLSELFPDIQVDVADIEFDDSGFFSGNGTCPPGIDFEFRGTIYTIPMNAWCQLSEILSFLLIALSTFVAARIIFASF